MSSIGQIKKTIIKEGFNANKGGSAITSFMKKHPEIKEYLKTFIHKFPCFEKESEVLAWLKNGMKIRKCLNCSKRLTYRNTQKGSSVACSIECSKSEICRKRKNELRIKKIIENHGENVNPFSKEDVKEKIRKTNLEKWGVENPMQNKCVAEKSGKNRKEKYDISARQLDMGYERFISRLSEAKLKLNGDRETYVGGNNGTVYNLHCEVCGKDFNYKMNNMKKLQYACPFCYPSNRSIAETQVGEFISEFAEIYVNDRTILNGNELDIVIPDKKIAIEYNGLFWHSDTKGKDKHYHINKLNKCNENGYRLIQIFEDEWENKGRIVRNRLKTILGLSSVSIGARKCVVKEVDNDLAKKFLDKYHLQGHGVSSVRLGLFYKNRLVALMTFSKSRFNKNYKWELLRYCTIGNFSIVGGASKILKEFRKKHDGCIISYADKRWSDGDLYRKLGFEELDDSSVAYWYVKDGIRYNRVQFQKHKLSKILEKYNENLSESDNMKMNGYHKVYDCGNKVFVLK